MEWTYICINDCRGTCEQLYKKGDIAKIKHELVDSFEISITRKYYFSFISKEEFSKNFIPCSDKYYIKEPKYISVLGQKIIVKKGLSIKLKRLNANIFKEMYFNIFFYIDEIKKQAPEILEGFADSIYNTLSNLEKMSAVLTEKEFIEAIQIVNPLIVELYEKSLNLAEKSYEERAELTDNLLNCFKEDIDSKISFYKEIDIPTK